jgi:two-component system sensor histidine kinase CpxA
MRFALWQRVFVYTVVFLVISQILTYILHRTLLVDNVHQYFANHVKSLVAEFKNQPLEQILFHARVLSHGRSHIWLTHTDGSAIEGQSFSRKTLDEGRVSKTWEQDGLIMVEVETTPSNFWIISPIQLREGVFSLYMMFAPPPNLFLNGFLFQTFVPVLILSIMLALWTAWRISRPLRRLRNEILELSETGPDFTVSVTGKDEISEVAEVVNAMAANLARNVRSIRAFVANASHELRSPLARANLALEIVEESLPQEYVHAPGHEGAWDEEPSAIRKRMASKYLTSLKEELTHMNTLIGTLLLTQKLEVRQEEALMSPMDFSSLCVEVCDRYSPMFARSNLTFETSVKPELQVLGNRTLLLQMLTNLLDNALKYTKKDGEIHFTVSDRSKKCMVCVENSYEQMKDSDLEQIFLPFHRINQPTGTGVGLGLSLVQKTVALHEGEIMAVSTELGLCICIQLPLAQPGGDSHLP